MNQTLIFLISVTCTILALTTCLIALANHMNNTEDIFCSKQPKAFKINVTTFDRLLGEIKTEQWTNCDYYIGGEK